MAPGRAPLPPIPSVACPKQMALSIPLTETDPLLEEPSVAGHLRRYPRIRFMGSKYRLASRLAEIFRELPPGPAVDAFSGSGVVSYALKATGRSVLANDHLVF